MKPYIFLLSILFLGINSYCQTNSDFPYKGGRGKFEKDFSYYFEKHGFVNDTSCVYFIVFSKSKNNAIEFEMYGSKKTGRLYKALNDFLKSTIKNWDSKLFRNTSYILPFFISTWTNPVDRNKEFVDWPEFNGTNKVDCKNCIMLSPYSFITCCASMAD